MGKFPLLVGTGLAVLAAAALAHNLPRLAPGLFDWAEPGNVAAALVQGRGFSDPFDGGTGATAWVSPLPVFVEAAVFLLLGAKTAAAAKAMLVLSTLGLACANALLLLALAPYGAWMRGTASAAFLAACALLPGSPLEVLSEAWLDILLSAALLWSVLEASRSKGKGAPPAFIAVALLAPLENAGLAVSVGVAVLFLAWRSRHDPRRLVVPAAAALATFLSVGAWTARNVVTLGHVIPLKSNFWFELNLANVDSADGLPRMETVLRRLPFFSVPEFNRYSSLGEVAYVNSFRAPALAALRADPDHFRGNILRRLGAATVFLRREGGGEYTKFPMDAHDLGRIAVAGEIIPMGASGGLWTRIDASPDDERRTLHALNLDNERGIWGDWLEKRLAYDERFRGLGGTLLGFLSAGVPVAALLLSALLRGGTLAAPAGWAAAIAFGMLLPFVLVNHNERHQLPLLAMQAVALGGFAQALAGRWRPATP
ncbi:MAG TPA: hypothetical protein VII09_07300 [Opitutaceae bacterium]